MRKEYVLEYEWIGKNERVSLTDSQLALLDKLTATLPGNVIEWQRNRFRFCGYCGVIKVGRLTLEILPKIHGTETEPGKSRELLIRMLSAVKKLDLTNTGTAGLNLQKHVLLDVFVLSFAEQLERLLRRGMVHRYVGREDNLQLLRGKIDVSAQIRHNICRQDRIACKYDEFVADNLQNQIVRAALVRLSLLVKSDKVQRVIERLCGAFSDISDYWPVKTDWDRLTLDRTNEAWIPVLEQCRWFLEGMNPDVVSGDAQSISLLFAMNTLFEEYVGVELKKALIDDFEVLAQRPQKRLLRDGDGNERFVMKPDLYVRKKVCRSGVAILDTKWKLLNAEDRKMGISQADLYQMFAYARSYDLTKVVLLYPRQSGYDQLDRRWHFADRNTELWVQQVNLEDILKGRGNFRQQLKNVWVTIIG